MTSNTNKPAIKIISPTVHGVLDYAVVVFLLIAPSIFPAMGSTLAVVVYALAVVHLALTVLTRAPTGLFDVIPLRIHGLVELLVAIGLVASPWVLAFADSSFSRNFVILFGTAVFLVWLLSDFGITYGESAEEKSVESEDSNNETPSESDDETGEDETSAVNHPSDHA